MWLIVCVVQWQPSPWFSENYTKEMGMPTGRAGIVDYLFGAAAAAAAAAAASSAAAFTMVQREASRHEGEVGQQPLRARQHLWRRTRSSRCGAGRWPARWPVRH